MKTKMTMMVAALWVALCGAAFAEVPEAYTDAIDDVAADVISFLTTTFGVLAGVAIVATLGVILIRKLKSAKAAVALAGAALLAGATESYAAVPAAYTTAVTNLATDVSSFLTSTFGVLAGVAIVATLGVILIRKLKAAKSAV